MSIRSSFISATLLLAVSSAFANSSGTGKVTALQTGSNLGQPYVFVTFEPAPQLSSNTCASAGETRLMFDPSTEDGEVMTAFLLSAKAAGQSVEYRSSGVCITQQSSNWKWEMIDVVKVK